MFTSTCTFGMSQGEWAGVIGNLWGTCGELVWVMGRVGWGYVVTNTDCEHKKKGQAYACPYKVVGYHFFHWMCLFHTVFGAFLLPLNGLSLSVPHA